MGAGARQTPRRFVGWLGGALIGAAIMNGASAQTPRLTMIGLGAGASCAEWTAQAATDEALEQWAFGFVSAIAATVQLERGGDPLAQLSQERIHIWLEGFCEQRPTTPLSVALVRMIYAASP